MVIYPIKGLTLGTAAAHIRYANRQDLVILHLAKTSRVAGVFTQNAFAAAPVIIAREHLTQTSAIRALIINTGNANAATGNLGIQNARKMCSATAQALQLTETQVLPFSTGVIGEQLPIDKITTHIPAAVQALNAEGWQAASQGIMTTDTKPKLASVQAKINHQIVHITGMAKGAGMIQPNMATMLSFIATDANIPDHWLKKALNEAVEVSFNAITIDSDTSTNDACLLIATAQGEATVNDDHSYQQFVAILKPLMIELAHGIVRDGEGASKFITVEVQGGKTWEDCKCIAFSIANSPLVKTALYASDPNWGRIAMAIGKAGVQSLVADKIHLNINNVRIMTNGGLDPNYTESAGEKALQAPELHIMVALNQGNASHTVWTCDFSEEYVRINADYRS